MDGVGASHHQWGWESSNLVDMPEFVEGGGGRRDSVQDMVAMMQGSGDSPGVRVRPDRNIKDTDEDDDTENGDCFGEDARFVSRNAAFYSPNRAKRDSSRSFSLRLSNRSSFASSIGCIDLDEMEDDDDDKNDIDDDDDESREKRRRESELKRMQKEDEENARRISFYKNRINKPLPPPPTRIVSRNSSSSSWQSSHSQQSQSSQFRYRDRAGWDQWKLIYAMKRGKQRIVDFCRREPIVASMVCLVAILVVVALTSLGIVLRDVRVAEQRKPHPVSSDSPASFQDQRTQLFSVLEKVVSLGWSSDPEIVYDPSQPQYQAARWIVSRYRPQDSKFPAPSQLSTVQQEYALATLYFATGGPTTWTYKINFLSSAYNNMCDWNLWFKDATVGEQVKLGVDCDASRTSVQRLDLSQLGLQGSLPSEIALLQHLTELDLSWNALTGTIPKEIFRLPQVTVVNLHHNKLTGSFPVEIGTTSTVTKLDLSFNSLTGTLPEDSLSSLTSIDTLNLSSNNVTGPLVPLTNLKTLQTLVLHGNELTGDITQMDFTSSWPKLQVLDVSNNNLSGMLSGNLWYHEHLTWIDLSQNQLNGNIPVVPDDSSNKGPLLFTHVSLQGNPISGSISSTVSRLEKLEHLDFSDCLLTGEIPNAFSTMSTLTYLNLSGNDQLTPGPIPGWIGNLKSLVSLSLQSTRRNGSIPTELGALKRLTRLNLENNELTGSIPSSLSEATSLRLLGVSRNKLTGTIPASFADLSSLQMLLLHNNGLTGHATPVCAPRLKYLATLSGDCTPRLNNASESNGGVPQSWDYQLQCSCCTECCDPTNADSCSSLTVTTNTDNEGWDNPSASRKNVLTPVDSSVQSQAKQAEDTQTEAVAMDDSPSP